MTQLPLQFRGLVGLAIVATCLFETAAPAGAQVIELSQAIIAQRGYAGAPYRRSYGNYYGAVDALASRVFAQAEFLRASGEASVNYATARKIRAQAVRLEIENSVLRIEAYWERKAIGEAERFKRRTNLLDSKRRQNSKTWDRLKNHPDVNGPAIANGRALNFLLHRLSASILAYEYSREYSGDGDRVAQQLTLPPDKMAGLQLRQHLPNGKSLIFTADDPAPLKVDWWPHTLRADELETHRADFAKQREKVVKEARVGKISNKSLQELNESFMSLSDEFRKQNKKSQRHSDGFRSWEQYKQADSFLKSMWGEIGRLQSVGDISFLDGELQFDTDRDGNNLVALLKFMSRNGLDFAPSKPGGENSYHFVFAMMRDLYANVADDDEALKPQTEKYQRE
ncbi:MAG: hypothetical protein HON53_03755 [Planctomycetaceae bacterium]|nr:hypothetical protein [Planctomycetaceae bacterium]MBT6154595.1 hypothetical protein [Planctomycetaceae bacterium]MBT6487205.1 hypothetical protein [Planctomycetaceae bacterium]MBT6498035.1 hypothetical protein [Planctomycetaceae bacterium]